MKTSSSSEVEEEEDPEELEEEDPEELDEEDPKELAEDPKEVDPEEKDPEEIDPEEEEPEKVDPEEEDPEEVDPEEEDPEEIDPEEEDPEEIDPEEEDPEEIDPEEEHPEEIDPEEEDPEEIDPEEEDPEEIDPEEEDPEEIDPEEEDPEEIDPEEIDPEEEDPEEIDPEEEDPEEIDPEEEDPKKIEEEDPEEIEEEDPEELDPEEEDPEENPLERYESRPCSKHDTNKSGHDGVGKRSRSGDSTAFGSTIEQPRNETSSKNERHSRWGQQPRHEVQCPQKERYESLPCSKRDTSKSGHDGLGKRSRSGDSTAFGSTLEQPQNETSSKNERYNRWGLQPRREVQCPQKERYDSLPCSKRDTSKSGHDGLGKISRSGDSTAFGLTLQQPRNETSSKSERHNRWGLQPRHEVQSPIKERYEFRPCSKRDTKKSGHDGVGKRSRSGDSRAFGSTIEQPRNETSSKNERHSRWGLQPRHEVQSPQKERYESLPCSKRDTSKSGHDGLGKRSRSGDSMAFGSTLEQPRNETSSSNERHRRWGLQPRHEDQSSKKERQESRPCAKRDASKSVHDGKRSRSGDSMAFGSTLEHPHYKTSSKNDRHSRGNLQPGHEDQSSKKERYGSRPCSKLDTSKSGHDVLSKRSRSGDSTPFGSALEKPQNKKKLLISFPPENYEHGRAQLELAGLEATCNVCKEKGHKATLCPKRQPGFQNRENKAPDNATDNATLYVGSLPPFMSQNLLKALFSRCGDIVSTHVAIDHETGSSKGYGFVTFKKPDEAAAAIPRMNGSKVGETRLAVSFKFPSRRGPRTAASSARFPGDTNFASSSSSMNPKHTRG